MTEHENKATNVNVCSWCKEQIKESEVDKHAGECALIPADEKENLKKTHQNAIETIEAAPSKEPA